MPSDNQTPFIDTLATQGVRFMETRTVSPMRLPALASLHTGRSPQSHGLRVNQSSVELNLLPTLAMLLQAEGFRSAAFISEPSNWRDIGIMRGFDSIDAPPSGSKRLDSATVKQAIQWVDALPPQDSLFAWIHLSSPLNPWDIPIDSETIQRFGVHNATITEVDQQTGRLFSALETNGRAASARMVIAGTHGLSLGEHGERDHGWYAYDSTIRVPLVLWWGIEAGIDLNRGIQVTGPASLLDILPTIGAIEGFELPQHEGISLLDHVSEGIIPVRELAFESMYPAIGWGSLPIFGILDKNGQTWFAGSPPSVYDLKSDPGQLQNRYTEMMADEASELFARFPRNWTPPLPRSENTGTAFDLKNQSDEWVQDRYWDRISPGEMYPLIQSLLNDDPRLSPHQLADHCLNLLDQLGPKPELVRFTLKFLDQTGQRKQANRLLETIQSDIPEWRNLLSERRIQERQQRALLSRIRAAISANPTNETAPVDLAITLSWLEEWSEAEAQLIAITTREPTHIQAHIQLARLYLKQENPGRALEVLENAQNGELKASIECEMARVLYRYMDSEDEAVSQLQSCQSNGGTLHPADRQVMLGQTPD